MLGRFSIRWRLAIISSALTFLVLCGFAIVVGQLTTGKVRSSFDSETANSATELSGQLRLPSHPDVPHDLPDPAGHQRLRGVEQRGDPAVRRAAATRPGDDGRARLRPADAATGSREAKGYLVETRRTVAPIGLDTASPHSVRDPHLDRVRAAARGGQGHDPRRALVPGDRRLHRDAARVPRRPGARQALAAADHRPDRDRARHRAHRRPRPPGARVPRRGRGLRAGADAQRDARGARGLAARDGGRARPPARVRRRRLARAAHAADLGPREPRAARRRRSTARSGRPRRPRCAARAGCAASSPICCCSPGRTPARSAASARSTSARSPSTPSARPACSRPTTCVEVVAEPGLVVEGARDELHRLVLNLVENAINHTPPGTHIEVRVAASQDCVRADRGGRRPRRPARAARADVRALRALQRRPRRLDRSRARDRARRDGGPRRRGARSRTPSRARASSCPSRGSTSPAGAPDDLGDAARTQDEQTTTSRRAVLARTIGLQAPVAASAARLRGGR